MLQHPRGRQQYLASTRRRYLLPWDTEGAVAVRSPSIWLLQDGKLYDQLLCLDFDPRDVGVDQAAVVNRRRWLEMLSNRLDDQCLDIGCRNPAY
jgi:hypothetical protein